MEWRVLKERKARKVTERRWRRRRREERRLRRRLREAEVGMKGEREG